MYIYLVFTSSNTLKLLKWLLQMLLKSLVDLKRYDSATPQVLVIELWHLTKSDVQTGKFSIANTDTIHMHVVLYPDVFREEEKKTDKLVMSCPLFLCHDNLVISANRDEVIDEDHIVTY